jgi:tRNA nucleotidyltransferase/poly(A) polymerase
MKIKKYIDFIKESRISVNMPLPNDIILISNEFIKNGKDIFVVGGAVRDFVKGINPKDYDLVTNALPEESKKILQKFNVSDEQGKNFGVLRIYTKDEPDGYELASYRKDISKGRDTKGKDQKVEMGEHITIEDDCKRRDLTINALFYDIKRKEIVDIVGGVDDIKNNIIRSVGDAKLRFDEDRLRILRIFRFSSRMNGKIDTETSNAIKADNRLRGISSKDDVSSERIWDEIKKSYSQSKNFTFYLNLLKEHDMFNQILPGLKINTNIEDTNCLEIYIANLLVDNNPDKLMNILVQDLKIEIDFARKVVFLISLLNLNYDSVVDLYKKKIVARVSDDVILEWYKVRDISDKIFTSFLKYKPSVSAEDLMKKGFKDAELGKEIKRLEIENFKKLIYEPRY